MYHVAHHEGPNKENQTQCVMPACRVTSPLVEALSTLPLASKHIVLCLVAIGQAHVLTVPDSTRSKSPSLRSPQPSECPPEVLCPPTARFWLTA